MEPRGPEIAPDGTIDRVAERKLRPIRPTGDGGSALGATFSQPFAWRVRSGPTSPPRRTEVRVVQPGSVSLTIGTVTIAPLDRRVGGVPGLVDYSGDGGDARLAGFR